MLEKLGDLYGCDLIHKHPADESSVSVCVRPCSLGEAAMNAILALTLPMAESRGFTAPVGKSIQWGRVRYVLGWRVLPFFFCALDKSYLRGIYYVYPNGWRVFDEHYKCKHLSLG